MISQKKVNNKFLSSPNLSKIEILFEKYGFFIFLGLSVIATFFVFKDFLSGDLLYYFKDIGSDSVNATLPNYFQGEYLSKSDGYFKTWTFYTGMGQRLPLIITLNPISHLNGLIQSLFGVEVRYYRIYLIYFFNFLPIGIFAFLYFRTLNYSKYTAIIGALLFQFSGYLIVGSQWGHSYKILYSIFLFFSFEQFLLKKRWFYFPIAIYLLSDNFFFLAVNMVFLAIYSFVRFISENDGKIKGYFSLVLKMAGLGVLAVALNAPRAITNFLTMYESPRVSGSSSQAHLLISNPEVIDGYLRRVTTTLRFFGNDLLGSGSEFKGWYNYLEAPLFYIGLLSLILMFSAFAFFKKKQRIYYGLFLGFWLLVAFIPILRHAVNFFIGNYFKNSIDIFVPFTILFFAMFAFEKIQSGKKLNPLIIVSTVGVLLVILHAPYFEFTNSVVNFNMKLIISLFLLIYGVLIFLLNSKQNKSVIKVLILLTIVIEVSYISWYSVNDREVYTSNELISDMAGYKDGTIDVVDMLAENDNSLFYRIEKDYSSGNSDYSSLNDAKAQGYFGTPSYGSFNQKYYIRFLEEADLITKGKEGQSRWANGVRGIPLLMTFANVKYFLAHDLQSTLRNNGYDSIGYQNNILILKNKYYLPFGYTYDKYLPFDDYKKLSSFKKQQALLSAVILEENSNSFDLQLLDTNQLTTPDKFNLDIYSSMIDSLRRDTFEMANFMNKKFDGKISLSENKLLFFTIPYDKGWRVFVDGKRVETILTNTGFTGIYLKSGNYSIKLKYLPPYFEKSLVVAILALLGFGLIFFLNQKKSKIKK